MCTYSMVAPAFDQVIPHPTAPWSPGRLPWEPLPTGLQLSDEQLGKILKAFRDACAAAKAADEVAGQPDCEDPEKVKLRERVAELERRLSAIHEASVA